MDIVTAVILTIVGLVISCLSLFLVLFFVFPQYMMRIVFMIQEYQAGMKVKYATDSDGFVYCYGEKNKPHPEKTSIVFLHGFTASKDQWLAAFKGLPSDLHLIAVDMPGHGATSIPDLGVKPNTEFVNHRLNKFLDLVGFVDKKVHLVGVSLGGAVAGIFSASFPERVHKVSLMCPAMNCPVENQFAAELKKAKDKGEENISYEDCPLLPGDVESFRRVFSTCTYNDFASKGHDQIWKGLMLLRMNKRPYYLRLYKTNIQNWDILNTLATKIQVPSQIIWGVHDQLLDVSGAEVLKDMLPNCQRVDILDKCGHVITMDRPGLFCKVLGQFIQEDVTEAKVTRDVRVTSWPGCENGETSSQARKEK